MTELRFFRLTLVLLAAVLLFGGSGWGWFNHLQSQAQVGVESSFGEYNKYIAACGDDRQGDAWDLARRSRDRLATATASRDFYAAQAEATVWLAVIAACALVLAFYAFRWAMTGRVRPLWLLRRPLS